MDLAEILRELDRTLEIRIESQRRTVYEAAHRVDPRLTWDDVVNPDNPALRASEAFQYEDGTLAGLLAARIQVRARLKELGAGAQPAAAGARTVHLHDDGRVAYRYCPRCGGSLELRRHISHDPPRLTCMACGFVFYLDPKVATGVILEQEDGIVLARRGIEPRVGFWGFPSGYVDRGERVEDAAAREVREEVGLEAAVDRLVGVYSYSARPVVVVVFAGRAIGGRLVAGDETDEVGTFRPDAIPWDDLAFPSTREALQDYLGIPRG